jgi:hypothetical protein
METRVASRNGHQHALLEFHLSNVEALHPDGKAIAYPAQGRSDGARADGRHNMVVAVIVCPSSVSGLNLHGDIELPTISLRT